MKILRVSLAALGCFAAVSTAEAKELTFYFDVFSSGPEIYPCDAGIWQGEQPKYCHFKGTATNCNPNDLGKTPGQTGVQTGMSTVDGTALSNYFTDAHACICTGGKGDPNTGVRGGDYLMNFMRYKAAVWQGQNGSTDPNHRGWSPAVERTAQGTLDGVTVARHVRQTQGMSVAPATSVEQEFQTQLEAVTFNFGSELYGAHFFVDFCYRGPQIPYWLGQGNPMNANAQFGTFAWLKSTNPFTGGDATSGKPTLNYTSLSNLKMKTVMVCDRQGQGTYKYDHNGTSPSGGTFDSFLMDIRDQGNIDVNTLASNGVLVSNGGSGVNPNQHRFILSAPNAGTNWVGTLEGDRKYGPVSLTDLSVRPDQYWLFGGANGNTVTITDGATANTPRFCKLRTYFVEESGKRERAWQRHDARFIVKWLVEENVEGDTTPE